MDEGERSESGNAVQNFGCGLNPPYAKLRNLNNLLEKHRNTVTYCEVMNSISVIKFSIIRESILCYQDRWIVVLFGYPVQQLSETPRYNLQITVNITSRIPQLQQSAVQMFNDMHFVINCLLNFTLKCVAGNNITQRKL